MSALLAALMGGHVPGLKMNAGVAQPMNQVVDPGATFPAALRNVQLTEDQQARQAFPEYGDDALAMWRRMGRQPQAAPAPIPQAPQGPEGGTFGAVDRLLQQQQQQGYR